MAHRRFHLAGDVATYGISHRPPDDGPPLYDLLEGHFAPHDIYTTPSHWYTGFPQWLPDVDAKIRSARGKPDARVWVYRAGPTSELNPGDWIGLSRDYVNLHRNSMDPQTYKTCAFRVEARHVRWAADDLMEWGYWGPPVKRPWNLCAKSTQYRGPKSRALGTADTDDASTPVTAADLDALEAFIADGAPVAEAKRLAEVFDFEPGERTYEGDTYRWMLVTIADPNAVDETPDGRFIVTAQQKLVWRRHKDADYISVEAPQAILESYAVDPSEYLPQHDELADFWRHPSPLYHATTEDHVDDILEEGLRPRNATRGLRNRGVSAAVFTTTNLETASYGSYGDVIFEIDTAAMARDGYTPEVTLEPDVVEAEGVNALAWALGIEDRVAEPENDPDTVIVHGAIPPEYLRRLD